MRILVPLFVSALFVTRLTGADPTNFFESTISKSFSKHCYECHNDQKREGGLSLQSARSFAEGGESGDAVVPSKPDDSLLVQMISGDRPEMPKDSEPLSKRDIEAIVQWIKEGAKWPGDFIVPEPEITDQDWWSLQPIASPAPPQLQTQKEVDWARTPIDRFVLAKLREKKLTPSIEADRRTLIRRLYFDLIGLPPDPEQVNQFVKSTDVDAYDKLVEQLLESPHYGERWARHWLDVVHYGDTHGYDKDKLRPNAWPYRDYVIRSFNENKPYNQFVQEQLAGDVLWPDTRDGIEATGFISAGPWDFIGHAEVPETKIDGQVARHLDRDDMVTSTMNTFMSLTVQCARCHNHKFDPISQEHYYSMQAIFAALDRADREYDASRDIAQQRSALTERLEHLSMLKKEVERQRQKLGGETLQKLDQKIASTKNQLEKKDRPEFGYHSAISKDQDSEKWVQVDLGEAIDIENITIVGAKDDFNGIGEGFGFPVRFRLEVSTGDKIESDSTMVANRTSKDFPNPGVKPTTFTTRQKVRYIRLTATKLAPRDNDYILAIGELLANSSDGRNVAEGTSVQSLDSIEAPVRWQRTNLVDGYYVGGTAPETLKTELAILQDERSAHLAKVIPNDLFEKEAEFVEQIESVKSQIETLPKPLTIYAGTIHNGSGAFQGTGHNGGKPREIHVLARGNILSPLALVGPGVVPVIQNVSWRFSLPEGHVEGDRRAALAKWIVRKDNPLTWRSIVNRVWSYHFGRGIVASPNDFGRMGQLPTHPELLDWLADQFRQNDSIKDLHRLIVTSSVYRQSSDFNEANSAIDAGNQFYWKMDRRLIDADALRDSVLAVSGKLDRKMYGPAFQDFVLEHPEHSPHYEYHKHDPNDPKSHRRSVYRFLVRSQQQPFMQTLDCADPSQSVAKRGSTITAIQALTLFNNKFMVAMSEHFAKRVESLASDPKARIFKAFELALARQPNDLELDEFCQFAAEHGLANACRVIFNLNEFVFVD